MQLLIKNHTDLFTVSEDYSLAHCISEDCAMGKGIAVEFANRFECIRYRTQKALLNKRQKENKDLAYPCTVALRYGNRFIFNLVTKEKYWHKPTNETMYGALTGLKKACIYYGIKKIAMPAIGCGLDKLKWHDVENMLREVFNDMDIEILICTL